MNRNNSNNSNINNMGGNNFGNSSNMRNMGKMQNSMNISGSGGGGSGAGPQQTFAIKSDVKSVLNGGVLQGYASAREIRAKYPNANDCEIVVLEKQDQQSV